MKKSIAILSKSPSELVRWVQTTFPQPVYINQLFGIKGASNKYLVDSRLRHVVCVWQLGEMFMLTAPKRMGVFSAISLSGPVSVSMEQIWAYAALFHDIGMWNQSLGPSFLNIQKPFLGFNFAPPLSISNGLFNISDFYFYYSYVFAHPFSERFEHGILGALILLNSPGLLFPLPLSGINKLTLSLIGQVIATHNLWPIPASVNNPFYSKALQKRTRQNGFLSFALCVFDTLDGFKRLFDSGSGGSCWLISKRSLPRFSKLFLSSFKFGSPRPYCIEINLVKVKKAFCLMKHNGYSTFNRWVSDVLALPRWVDVSVEISNKKMAIT